MDDNRSINEKNLLAFFSELGKPKTIEVLLSLLQDSFPVLIVKFDRKSNDEFDISVLKNSTGIQFNKDSFSFCGGSYNFSVPEGKFDVEEVFVGVNTRDNLRSVKIVQNSDGSLGAVMASEMESYTSSESCLFKIEFFDYKRSKVLDRNSIIYN